MPTQVHRHILCSESYIYFLQIQMLNSYFDHVCVQFEFVLYQNLMNLLRANILELLDLLNTFISNWSWSNFESNARSKGEVYTTSATGD